MAAELDDWGLVEQSAGVQEQTKHSRADEPRTHVTHLASRAHDQSLLSGGDLPMSRDVIGQIVSGFL